MEHPNGAGPGMPGPFRSHLDAGDFDGVAVHGARDGYLVAGMSYNFVLVGNLIDFAVIGHQYSGRAAFDALGCARFVAKHGFFGRAVRIYNRAGPIRSHRRDGGRDRCDGAHVIRVMSITHRPAAWGTSFGGNGRMPCGPLPVVPATFLKGLAPETIHER